MSALKDKIMKNISGMESQTDLKSILDYLNFLKEKEDWDATFDILKDKKTMSRIKKGLNDIKKGNIYSFEAIKRHV
jgi:hypothetical protein